MSAGLDRPLVKNERAPALLDKDTASGIATQAAGTDMAGYDRVVGVRLRTATQNVTTVYINSRRYRGTGVTPSTVVTDHEYVAYAAYSG